MSVKNYSPRLVDIFKLAAEKEFRFDCKTEKKARALRARLHALRRAMRAENYWMQAAADRVVISIDGKFLVAHPPDVELEDELTKALREQGLKIETKK